MKLEIEGREFTLSANGRFLKKYFDLFNDNLTITLYNATQKRDPFAVAKLMYCAINEERTFEEWLDSFSSPIFIIPYMDKIIQYLLIDTTPKVEAIGGKEEKK